MSVVSTESRWMTLKEVTEALECSPFKVRSLVEAGEIRYHRNPGYRRYLRSDVERIVGERELSEGVPHES